MRRELREFTYKGKVVGRINNPAKQLDGIYIHTTPRKYVNPDTLSFMLTCLLDGYDWQIGPTGEVYLRIPKKTRYGPLLNGIAKAYYELQTGKTRILDGQQRLVEA